MYTFMKGSYTVPMSFLEGFALVEGFMERKEFKTWLQLINCLLQDYNNKPSEQFLRQVLNELAYISKMHKKKT